MVEKEASRNGETASHRSHRLSNDSSESEEEIQLRLLAKRSSKSPIASPSQRSTSQRSPAQRSPSQRSVSYSATVTASYMLNDDIHEDRENWVEGAYAAPKTPVSAKTGSGAIPMSKVRSSPRRTAEARSESRGVRKASGRIGSSGSPTRVK